MDTNNQKPCIKTCIISFIAVYVFIMAYAFLVHGILLKPEYDATAALWRPVEEMQKLGPLCWIMHAVLAAAIVCLFKKFRSSKAACDVASANTRCPIKSGGLCFGFKLGIILGIYLSSMYIHLPIPESLAIKWFFSEFFMGLGIGAVLGMVCKPGNCDATNA